MLGAFNDPGLHAGLNDRMQPFCILFLLSLFSSSKLDMQAMAMRQKVATMDRTEMDAIR